MKLLPLLFSMIFLFCSCEKPITKKESIKHFTLTSVATLFDDEENPSKYIIHLIEYFEIDSTGRYFIKLSKDDTLFSISGEKLPDSITNAVSILDSLARIKSNEFRADTLPLLYCGRGYLITALDDSKTNYIKFIPPRLSDRVKKEFKIVTAFLESSRKKNNSYPQVLDYIMKDTADRPPLPRITIKFTPPKIRRNSK